MCELLPETIHDLPPNHIFHIMTETALKVFLEKMERFLVSKGRTNTRLFVCKGDPTLCSVFIVGFNPTTDVAVDGEILNKEIGFNLELFYNRYSEERARRAAMCKQEDKRRYAGVEFAKLKPHRQINPNFPCKISRTRANMEVLAAAIEEALVDYDRPGVLEANIHWQATADIQDFRDKYGDGDKGESLRFLINELNPLVILCHGKGAEEFFRANENRDLTACRALVVIGQDGAWPKGEDRPRCNHLSRFPRKKAKGVFLMAVVKEVVRRHKAARHGGC